jgi:hypothetical protein
MNVIVSIFGGLSREYYIRNFLFGLIFPAILIFMFLNAPVYHQKVYLIGIYALLSTLLYPYSRFVYEGIIDYIVGENRFFVNGLLYIGVKLFTMYLCWIMAIFIAPIGLIYLYFQKSKRN